MESTVVQRGEPRVGALRGRRKGVVVVGYDGSPNSKAALVRGADRVPEGGHLVVLRSLYVTPHHTPSSSELMSSPECYADAIASLLAAVPSTLSATHEIRVVTGSASAALVETAERYGASEVVIGAREGRTATQSKGVADALTIQTRIPVEVVTARRAGA